MKGNRIATRRRASSIPQITGVRLAPVGGEATLINISATGVLVECGTRVAPGMPLTVIFEGTFTPTSASSRVVRCEVAAIGSDSTLRFHLGLAFNQRLALVEDDEPADKEPLAVAIPLHNASASLKTAALRNRW